MRPFILAALLLLPLAVRADELTLTPDAGGHQHSNVELRGAAFEEGGLVGKPLPSQRYLSPAGDVLDAASLQGERNALLVFMREFPGFVCIGCSSQTLALAQSVNEFERRNTQVIVWHAFRANSVAVAFKLFVDRGIGRFRNFRMQVPQ